MEFLSPVYYFRPLHTKQQKRNHAAVYDITAFLFILAES